MALEIERRFLIEKPEIKNIDHCIEDILTIRQMYLDGDGVCVARIRSVSSKKTKENKFFLTRKTFVAEGISEEVEESLSNDEYFWWFNEIDKDRHAILKTRYVLNVNGEKFELDVFHSPLEGIFILEKEMPSIDYEFSIPPFIKVIKEITKDKRYSNFNLSLIDYGQLDSLK